MQKWDGNARSGEFPLLINTRGAAEHVLYMARDRERSPPAFNIFLGILYNKIHVKGPREVHHVRRPDRWPPSARLRPCRPLPRRRRVDAADNG
eukprot:3208229-Prymnesium_polylepis.2